MKYFVACLLLLSNVVYSHIEFEKPAELAVNINRVQHETSVRFLSVALPCNLLFTQWKYLRLNSSKVIALARHLGNSYLRFGGTCSNFIAFVPDEVMVEDPSHIIYPMRPSDWDYVYQFSEKIGWQLIFDANLLLRDMSNKWSPSNLLSLISYSLSKNYTKLSFELGNEPNALLKVASMNITGWELAQDYTTMNSVLSAFRRSLAGDSKFVGAEITSPDWNHDLLFERDPGYFMIAFLKALPKGVIDAFTWHQYYMPPNSPMSNFINITLLDRYKRQVHLVQKYIEKYSNIKGVPLWMGETSSAYGSGVPGMSDRFVASFMWLDKLGIAAQSHDVVIRQALYGGHYSLLNKTGDPTPDYWVSLLFKRHVGLKVFSVHSDCPHVRFYAHCTNSLSKYYRTGSLILYGMNLNKDISIPILLNGALGSPKRYLAFRFTASDGDLLSPTVDVNGQQFSLNDEYGINEVGPVHMTTIELDPLSYGFFIMLDASVSRC